MCTRVNIHMHVPTMGIVTMDWTLIYGLGVDGRSSLRTCYLPIIFSYQLGVEWSSTSTLTAL